MKRSLHITVLLATILLLAASCRKRYYNCECAYLNENDEPDTMMLAVRAHNSTKAADLCAEKEIDITARYGYYLFCRLQ